MLIPVEVPRDSRKRKEVNVLVFKSNLDSRYSYAVNTVNRWNMGTKLLHNMTIARGNPKEYWINLMPAEYACPGAVRKVIALARVPTTLRIISHHGIL